VHHVDLDVKLLHQVHEDGVGQGPDGERGDADGDAHDQEVDGHEFPEQGAGHRGA
jgi:hypothetical protein